MIQSEGSLQAAGFAAVPAGWFTSNLQAVGSPASSIEDGTTYSNYVSTVPRRQTQTSDELHDSYFGEPAAVPTADTFAITIKQSISMEIEEPFRVMTDCSGMEAPIYSLMKLAGASQVARV